MRAILSMLPVMKNIPSGDQAKSYISDPEERHMCLMRQVSLSSRASSPKAGVWEWVSDGTQSKVLPSSPALASISPKYFQPLLIRISEGVLPRGANRTTLTAWVCCNTFSNGFGNFPDTYFYECSKVCDISLFSIPLHFPQPDIIVSASGCKSTFPVGLEVYGVYW